MKPEWPLYVLGLLGAALILTAQAIFDWSEQTRDYVIAGFMVVTLWTYLPLMARKRDRETGSAASQTAKAK